MRKSALFIIALASICTPNSAYSQQRRITIVGTDYAFQAPETLTSGPAVFALKNDGTVHHQLLLYLLKEGRSMADYMRAPTPQERQGNVEELLGVIFASAPKASPGRLEVDLVAGRTYLLVCNDRDAADKPVHLQLGMVKSIRVE